MPKVMTTAFYSCK